MIHTVGPIWQGGDRGEPEWLAACYRNSLQLAVAHKVRRIAFPAISCGVYRYPLPDAARIAVREVRRFLATDEQIETVYLVCFDDKVRQACEQALAGK